MKRHRTLNGEQYRAGLHGFTLLVSACTFLLIVAGGMVTSTDSGLAVPDWPLSYGQIMPPMVGGIFYEHGHRMIATFVGFLTVILAIWLWRVEKRQWVRTLGLMALFAVILQGVLGGLTVIYLLPVWISVSHATLAQSFFSLTVFISAVTSRWWLEARPVEIPRAQTTRLLAILAVVVVFVQLILGALMRHTDSGLAVPDFPLTYGQLWPTLNQESLFSMNQRRAELDLLPVETTQIAIRLLHRLWALVVTVVIFSLARHVFRWYREVSCFRETALFLVLLVVFQVLLGALTVLTGKSPSVTTAHVATGSLILGGGVAFVSYAYRLLGVGSESRVFGLAPGGGSP